MNKTELESVKESLNKYQNGALALCTKYLGSKSKKSALVHLPTGCGKTGIMAVLCALIETNILIIVPNATLPTQILNEIKTNFWHSIKSEYIPDTNIILLNNKKQFSGISHSKKTIYIATIQFIHNNSYENKELNLEFINTINNNIGCIFFDEGHREPAKIWSEIIRKFSTKIILFTATPFRNDNSIFKIDKNYFYSERMRNFICDKIISEVKFLPLELESNKTSYLGAITKIGYKEKAKILEVIGTNLDNGKIIIRCKGETKIKNITRYLNNKGIATAGLHSNFKKEDNYYNSGKTIKNEEYKYDVFVHSDMLVEGLNIPAIKTIIFLDTFSNFRSTAQQIGRALRKGTNDARIYLPNCVLEEHTKQWENLLEYKYKDERCYIYESGLIRKVFLEDHGYKILRSDIYVPKKATIYFAEVDTVWKKTRTTDYIKIF